MQLILSELIFCETKLAAPDMSSGKWQRRYCLTLKTISQFSSTLCKLRLQQQLGFSRSLSFQTYPTNFTVKKVRSASVLFWFCIHLMNLPENYVLFRLFTQPSHRCCLQFYRISDTTQHIEDSRLPFFVALQSHWSTSQSQLDSKAVFVKQLYLRYP